MGTLLPMKGLNQPLTQDCHGTLLRPLDSVFVFVSVDVAPLVLLLFLSAGGAMWLLLPSLWGPMSMSIWPSSE